MQDTAEALDLVTLSNSTGMRGEMEADLIHSVLEANGIFSIVSGFQYIPFEFRVRVARKDLGEAVRLLEEARATGPAVVADAELETE